MLPFVALNALDHLGAGTVFTGSAVILVILCLDVAILGPRSTGRGLDTAAQSADTSPGSGDVAPSSG
ncbi:hypothetical protein [Actinoallomurus sp. CA-142502]|uniref:hypothetical protein n=1 Tax=Actinoallomurus sp. CA-142502 TaxID=3239885 RepID=UPI003D89C575